MKYNISRWFQTNRGTQSLHRIVLRVRAQENLDGSAGLCLADCFAHQIRAGAMTAISRDHIEFSDLCARDVIANRTYRLETNESDNRAGLFRYKNTFS